MSASKSKIVLEPRGRDTKAKWEPGMPVPMLYSVVGLTNCMKPQIGSVLNESQVQMLLDDPYRSIVIRHVKE